MQILRTMMFVPGNAPSMLRDAAIYGADYLMFDLEDAVSLSEKDAARDLVSQALLSLDYGGTPIAVRVNPLNTPHGEPDVSAVVKAGADAIRMPKTETPQDVVDMDNLITEIEVANHLPLGKTKIIAAIESPLGVHHAFAIATASPRLFGIAIGAEDFVTSMKTTRSPEGIELLFARSQVLHAARAAGIYALDTVFANVNDEATFRKEVQLIKQLGFDGKSIINPRQIDVVNEIFTPTEAEINKSIRIIAVAQEGEAQGLGVVSLDGYMIDKPIIERAQRVLALANAAGIDTGGSYD